MNVPFNEPGRNYLHYKGLIDDAISRVLSSGWYVLSPEVSKFEEAFASYCGAKYCVGVASGTDGLMIALRAVGVTVGDEVITAANAGGYATTACHQIGAQPVYTDVNEETLLLDPEHVARAISSSTRAIVVTHLFGNCVEMTPFLDLATKYDVRIIEDCSQAHGARREGHHAGSDADVGVFSFYPTKNLGALGDGGALICNDSNLAETILELRQYGWNEKYNVASPFGINSRLDPLQAAVLRVKLEFLDDEILRRRKIARVYTECAEELGLQTCHSVNDGYSGHLFVSRHEQRDAIRECLLENGVRTDIHYPVLDCDQPGWAAMPSKSFSLAVSRRAVSEIFSLPIFPDLTEDEVDSVCSALRRALDEYG